MSLEVLDFLGVALFQFILVRVKFRQLQVRVIVGSFACRFALEKEEVFLSNPANNTRNLCQGLNSICSRGGGSLLEVLNFLGTAILRFVLVRFEIRKLEIRVVVQSFSRLMQARDLSPLRFLCCSNGFRVFQKYGRSSSVTTNST